MMRHIMIYYKHVDINSFFTYYTRDTSRAFGEIHANTNLPPDRTSSRYPRCLSTGLHFPENESVFADERGGRGASHAVQPESVAQVLPN